MTLDYIYHSGFAIETETLTVIIDYYRDSSDMDSGMVHDRLLKRPGKLYVLSSHFHPDHFNKEILNWRNLHNDIQYIFSKDILDYNLAKINDAFYLDKPDVYKDELISIQAFGSTDAGISFLIHIDNMLIFHAGDLNNWHWNEESTIEEIAKAEEDYNHELEYLAQIAPKIDLVMFPVDYRLGKDYMKGAEQFINRIKTSIFVPMHFNEHYNKANAFGSIAEKKGVSFLTIHEKGESYDITK